MTELLSNGDFELYAGTAFTGWDITGTANGGTEAYARSGAAPILYYGGYISQTLTVAPGGTVNWSFYARQLSGFDGRHQIYDASNSADIVAATANGATDDNYILVSGSFTVPAGCTSIQFRLLGPTTNPEACVVDDASFDYTAPAGGGSVTDYYFRPCIALTGGGDGALDAIDGADLIDGEAAFVVSNGLQYIYYLDADSGAAEDSPNVIAPDSNAGDKRWILSGHRKIRMSDGTLAAPSLSFKDEAATGFYRSGNNNFSAVVNGREAFRYRLGVSMNNRPAFGSPINWGTLCPPFRFSPEFDVPALQIQNLMATGEDDSCDIALRRINGNNASPSAMNANEWAGALYWWPYDTSGNFAVTGNLFGAANNVNEWESVIANNSAVYSLNINLGSATPDPPVVFVQANNAATTLNQSERQTWNVDWNYNYQNATTTLNLYWINNNTKPANGYRITAFRNVNYAGVFPFYGRQAAIRAYASQQPTATGRGAHLVFSVCKNNQVVDRPRLWISQAGHIVCAGQAVAEADSVQGVYYPDRQHVGADFEGGCPSGVSPQTWQGKAQLTFPCVGNNSGAVIAFRSMAQSQNGIDFLFDISNEQLIIAGVNSDVRTERWTIGKGGNIIPVSNKDVDIGSASLAVDDVYADDFQNVADFLHLDSKDDLEVIDQITGSGEIDPRTGLEMIDDNTVPDWMLSKDKHGKEIVRSVDGKPYISMRMMTSLLMGACRKLNKERRTMKKKLSALDKRLKALEA